MYMYIYIYICSISVSDDQGLYNALRRHKVFFSCNTLQHTATHCNTLQHTFYCVGIFFVTRRAHCSLLTATHCNALQHSATCCITLQHAATRRNTCAIARVCVLLCVSSTVVWRTCRQWSWRYIRGFTKCHCYCYDFHYYNIVTCRFVMNSEPCCNVCCIWNMCFIYDMWHIYVARVYEASRHNRWNAFHQVTMSQTCFTCDKSQLSRWVQCVSSATCHIYASHICTRLLYMTCHKKSNIYDRSQKVK